MFAEPLRTTGFWVLMDHPITPLPFIRTTTLAVLIAKRTWFRQRQRRARAGMAGRARSDERRGGNQILDIVVGAVRSIGGRMAMAISSCGD